MQISEVTKRNIFYELVARKIVWSGRLSEVAFLKRIFQLDKLPTYDNRFKNMEEDICQHRMNNCDWDDWWIIEDERINLLDDDEIFLKFLCEMIHPVVRSEVEEVEMLLNVYNSYLIIDGWKIIEKNIISGRPVFVGVQDKSDIDFRNEEKISQVFVKAQLKKCDEKIRKNDYDGAISSSRSLVEGAIADIYERIVGEKMDKSGCLVDDFKKIKGLLNLSEDKHANDNIKAMLRSFIAILDAIDALSNKMGDRHRRLVEPMEHHAHLCVNSSKIFCDFLYDILNYQFQTKENLFEALISAINNEKRFWGRDKLKNDIAVKTILDKCDKYLRAILKDKFINDYEISSFRSSDICFAGLSLFLEDFSSKDIRKIFQLHKENGQACGLLSFLQEIKSFHPELIADKEIIAFLSKREI